MRATVVGRQVHAATIVKAASSYPVDVRMDLHAARFAPVELPQALTDLLLTLHDRLGLRYGAVDLKRRADGTWIFLEVNPAGQWLWVEERTDQPITAAVARLLAGAC